MSSKCHMCVHILCISPPARMDWVSAPSGNKECLLHVRPTHPPHLPHDLSSEKTCPSPDGATIYTPGFKPRASAARSQCTSSMLCYRCG